jgi:hypothetical protein
MNFKKILLGVIVVVILYLVYVYVFSDSTSSVLYSGGNAKVPKKVPATQLPANKQSVNFTFSIWIYVNNWQYRYGVEKVIYRRNDDSTTNSSISPQVSLGAATNQLAITIDTCPATGVTGTQNTCPSTPNSWTVNNIPIQKWCNIIVSTNNRAVDTYIDGKLVNTHVLINVPKMNKNAPIYVTPDGGFSGNTSKFRYIARVISPREAYEIYREGPGGNWLSDLLNQYKLKLSFLKGSEEINSFEI